MAPPGLQILVWWTKTCQYPHPGSANDNPADPVAAYCLLLTASSTTSAEQPLPLYLNLGRHTTVTVPILSGALAAFLHDLGYDAGHFSLHSLLRGGATAAYWWGLRTVLQVSNNC